MATALSAMNLYNMLMTGGTQGRHASVRTWHRRTPKRDLQDSTVTVHLTGWKIGKSNWSLKPVTCKRGMNCEEHTTQGNRPGSTQPVSLEEGKGAITELITHCNYQGFHMAINVTPPPRPPNCERAQDGEALNLAQFLFNIAYIQWSTL